jgi:peptidoglycan/LPS O-acetylase OafA/YrhL
LSGQGLLFNIPGAYTGTSGDDAGDGKEPIPETQGLWISILVYLPVTLTAAEMSWCFIEVPARQALRAVWKKFHPG